MSIPSYTYDLTQLSLSGTHTITAKAKKTGYADSNASNGVSYTATPSGYQVEIYDQRGDSTVYVYDGLDTTGTLLGTIGYMQPYPLVVNVSSGNLCITTDGYFSGSVTTVSGGVTIISGSESPLTYSVTGDGTINVWSHD